MAPKIDHQHWPTKVALGSTKLTSKISQQHWPTIGPATLANTIGQQKNWLTTSLASTLASEIGQQNWPTNLASKIGQQNLANKTGQQNWPIQFVYINWPMIRLTKLASRSGQQNWTAQLANNNIGQPSWLTKLDYKLGLSKLGQRNRPTILAN